MLFTHLYQGVGKQDNHKHKQIQSTTKKTIEKHLHTSTLICFMTIIQSMGVISPVGYVVCLFLDGGWGRGDEGGEEEGEGERKG